jgi:glycosyltransferase involved in cell wall biosynthesis
VTTHKRIQGEGPPAELLFLAPGDVRKARVEPISWMRSCQAFAARGLRVTLVTLRVRYPDAVARNAIWDHFSVPPSFRIRMLPTPLRRDSSTLAFRLWGGLASTALAIAVMSRLALRRRGLIVHSRSPIMLTPFWLLRRLLPQGRQPTLIYETHTLPPQSTWRMLRRADLLVVNSRKLETDLATRAGIRPERILHAPLPPYAPVCPRPKAEARAELDLPNAAPIACYSGKMLEGQCEFLLEVARLTRARVDDFHMMLVGGNPDILARLRGRVAEDGLEDTMILAGFVEPARVGTYQSAADVLVFHMDSDLPHFPYCTPAKGFDYQATGRPIVAGDLPLFDEVFGPDGERAIKVAGATPEAFAEAIEKALLMEDEGRAMTERAMSWVAGRTWQARADTVLDALSRAT